MGTKLKQMVGFNGIESELDIDNLAVGNVVHGVLIQNIHHDEGVRRGQLRTYMRGVPLLYRGEIGGRYVFLGFERDWQDKNSPLIISPRQERGGIFFGQDYERVNSIILTANNRETRIYKKGRDEEYEGKKKILNAYGIVWRI